MTRTIRLMLLAISMGVAGVADAQAQVRVETLSGTGQAGLADGNRQVGQLNRPHGLAVHGSAVYVSGLRKMMARREYPIRSSQNGTERELSMYVSSVPPYPSTS